MVHAVTKILAVKCAAERSEGYYRQIQPKCQGKDLSLSPKSPAGGEIVLFEGGNGLFADPSEGQQHIKGV